MALEQINFCPSTSPFLQFILVVQLPTYHHNWEQSCFVSSNALNILNIKY